jgi:hypothetical protein
MIILLTSAPLSERHKKERECSLSLTLSLFLSGASRNRPDSYRDGDTRIFKQTPWKFFGVVRDIF